MAGRISKGFALDTRAVTSAIRALDLQLARTQLRGEPVEIPSYTLANLPTPSSTLRFIAFCSDTSSGPAPIYWDGSDWRRFDTGNIVS